MFLMSSLYYITLPSISVYIVLITYALLTSLSFIAFNQINQASLYNFLINNHQHKIYLLFNILFFLNLAGIPPLPGFFIKINFLYNLLNYINIYLIVILLLLNFTIFYFYIKFYKTISVYNKTRVFNASVNSITPILTLLTLFINFYPLYNIFILMIL